MLQFLLQLYGRSKYFHQKYLSILIKVIVKICYLTLVQYTIRRFHCRKKSHLPTVNGKEPSWVSSKLSGASLFDFVFCTCIRFTFQWKCVWIVFLTLHLFGILFRSQLGRFLLLQLKMFLWSIWCCLWLESSLCRYCWVVFLIMKCKMYLEISNILFYFRWKMAQISLVHLLSCFVIFLFFWILASDLLAALMRLQLDSNQFLKYDLSFLDH